MKLPFKKVHRFGRDCQVVVSFDIYSPLLINVAAPKQPSYKVIREHNQFNPALILQSGIPSTAIAIDPNGDRFYMATGQAVAEYDVLGRLLRQVSLEDFSCGIDNSSFFELAQSSGNRLWLSVYSHADWISHILVWDPKKSPQTREMGPSFLEAWVDPVGEVAYICAAKGGVYDFRSRTFAERKWPEYSFFDFVDGRGLLLSSVLATESYDIISISKDHSQKPHTLTWGSRAQWGCDGYVYFVRRGTQLWRCDPNGIEPELVYSAARGIKAITAGFVHQLRFSRDRSLLAFTYREPRLIRKEMSGLVLLDLQNREYIEIEPERLAEACTSAGYRDFVKVFRGSWHMLEAGNGFGWVTNMGWLEGSE